MAMSENQTMGPFDIDRMVRAVEAVKERLLRATKALELANVSYAVVGGHAIGLWVSRVDDAAVRNTRDVDLLVRREDLGKVIKAMEPAGFVYRHTGAMHLMLDGENGKARDAVHLIFANEKVRPDEPVANPDVGLSEKTGNFRVLSLEPLVQIKLTAYRDKDRMHLRDLLDVGLIDQSWVPRFPAELAARLQHLIDHPE
jgi:hypothetical protein